MIRLRRSLDRFDGALQECVVLVKTDHIQFSKDAPFSDTQLLTISQNLSIDDCSS